MDGFGLPNSMTPILSLFVHCRVPVCVVENNTIRSSKIDTDSTAPCGRNKTENSLVQVKSVHQFLSVFSFD